MCRRALPLDLASFRGGEKRYKMLRNRPWGEGMGSKVTVEWLCRTPERGKRRSGGGGGGGGGDGGGGGGEHHQHLRQ